MYKRALRIVAAIILVLYICVDCVHAAPLSVRIDDAQLSTPQMQVDVSEHMSAIVKEVARGNDTRDLLLTKVHGVLPDDLLQKEEETPVKRSEENITKKQRDEQATWWSRVVSFTKTLFYVVSISLTVLTAMPTQAQDSVLGQEIFSPEIPAFGTHIYNNKDIYLSVLGGGFVRRTHGQDAIGLNIAQEHAENVAGLINGYTLSAHADLGSGSTEGRYNIYVDFETNERQYAKQNKRILTTYTEHMPLTWMGQWHTGWKETGWTPAFSHAGAGGVAQIMRISAREMLQQWERADNLAYSIRANKALLENETDPTDMKILAKKIEFQEMRLRNIKILAHVTQSDEKRPAVIDFDALPDNTFSTAPWFKEYPKVAISEEMQNIFKAGAVRRNEGLVQVDQGINIAFMCAIKHDYYFKLLYGMEVGKIDPHHKDALPRDMEIYLALEIMYNWGEDNFMKAIKGGWEHLLASLPAETRRYAYEYVRHVVFESYAEHTGETDFYEIIVGNPELSHKIIQRTIVQYHLDQADFRATQARRQGQTAESERLIKWLHSHAAADYANRFTQDTTSRGVPIRRKRTEYTNKNFSASLDHLDVSISNMRAEGEGARALNGFMDNILKDMDRYESLLSDVADARTEDTNDSAVRGAGRSGRGAQLIRTVQDFLKRIGTRMPWSFIAAIGAAWAFVLGGAIFRKRQRKNSIRPINDFYASPSSGKNDNDSVARVRQVAVLHGENGSNRMLNVEPNHINLFEGVLFVVVAVSGGVAALGVLSHGVLIGLAGLGVIVVSLSIRVASVFRVNTENARFDKNGAIRQELLDAWHGFLMILSLVGLMLLDYLFVKPVLGWGNSAVVAHFSDASGEKSSLLRRVSTAVFSKKEKFFSYYHTRITPYLIISEGVLLGVFVSILGLKTGLLIFGSLILGGYIVQVYSAIKRVSEGRVQVSAWSVLGLLLLGNASVSTVLQQELATAATFGVILGSFVAIVNKCVQLIAGGSRVQTVTRPGRVMNAGNRNLYRHALFLEIPDSRNMTQPIVFEQVTSPRNEMVRDDVASTNEYDIGVDTGFYKAA